MPAQKSNKSKTPKKISKVTYESPIKWIVLLFGPVVIFLITLIVTETLKFFLQPDTVSKSSTAEIVVIIANIALWFSSVVLIFSILIMPLWIVLWVKTVQLNNATKDKRLSKVTAIIFAVIFGLWAWVYTYETDQTKFWINFGLNIITISLWGYIAWVWAIIDMATRDEKFFLKVPKTT